MADYDRDGKRDTLLGFYNWLTDIHPQSWDQWRHQQIVKGFLPWYGSWMESRSADERNAHLRDVYGITLSSIEYPWLSGIMSNTADSVLPGQVNRTWQFSKNMASLYLKDLPSPRNPRRRYRRYRRY